jgi:hypothetical protein
MSTLREAAQAVVDAFADPNARANLRGHWLHLSDCITALRAALAQQEPVAWLLTGGTDVYLASEFSPGSEHEHEWTPLYTHPPRREWVGLTEEEVNALWASHDKTGEQITRAIEQALKERNT